MATRRKARRVVRRRNPGTIARTKLFGNSPIPLGRMEDVAAGLVDPERYAFKPHGHGTFGGYLLVKFASAEALERERDEDLRRAPADMGGGNRGMGKARVGWKPAIWYLKRRNPVGRAGKLYRLSDGSVLTAEQYKRLWPGGKVPSPAARRLLGITVVSGKRSNPRRRVRRNAPLSATEKRALKSILRKHKAKCNPRRRNPEFGVPSGPFWRNF